MPGDETDEQYKRSTKAVVDDAMRTDMLGPNLVRVLKDHKPAHDLLREVIAESIASDPATRKALGTFVDENAMNRKGKWIDRAMWLGIGAVITGVLGYLISLFLKQH